jgi:phosphoribosylformylglycinamidine (FGAM) synthase-like enzyme
MSRITRGRHAFEHFDVDLLNAKDDELREIGKTLGLGLSIEELRYIRDHYLLRERKATDIELQTYDQTFSEHCSHKTFRGFVETPMGRVDGLLKTYIRSVVEELKPSWCFSVFEDNAGIVDLEGDY